MYYLYPSFNMLLVEKGKTLHVFTIFIEFFGQACVSGGKPFPLQWSEQ